MNRTRTWLAYACIFLTGATALVYEVIWQRYLARLTGNDSLATALILGIFLAGLSAGYVLCGGLSRRTRTPVRVYAVIEGLIGVWALIFPHLFGAVASWTQSWSFAPPWWMLAQGTVCTVLLIGLPTLCMGGTIPLLTQTLSGSLAASTGVHARIYATNTAGAFVGVLAAGYFLVPRLGLPGALHAAAVLNLLAGLYFYCWPKTSGGSTIEQTTGLERVGGDSGSRAAFPVWAVYTISFLNGAAVMSLENVLLRITNLSLGSSTYSFSLLVGVFVLSLACGSYLVGFLKAIPRWLIFAAQAGALGFSWVGYVGLDDWPYAAHLVRAAFQGNPIGFWLFQGAVLSVLLAVLLVPVALLGTTLPLLFHELKRDLRSVGWHSGRIFSTNALGCMVGSLVGGWLLFYPLDLPGVTGVALVIIGLSATLAALPLGFMARTSAVLLLALSTLLALVHPGFDKSRFAQGTFGLVALTPFSLHGPGYFYENFRRGHTVRFYDDGPAGTVAVLTDNPEAPAQPIAGPLPAGFPMGMTVSATASNPPLAIMVNGKSDSDTAADRQTLKLSAHIPALWAEHRSRAMVIGLGTGVTVGELALYPDIQRLDVAELSPSVVQALPLFSNFTHQVQLDPRLHIEIGDAFRVLGRSRERWDLIISEPSNVWVTGVDLLFSREFYRLAREHLTEGGVLLQWVQKYAVDPQTFGILMNTVRSEFAHCCVYQGEPGDLLVLASARSFTTADQERAEAALAANRKVAESLSQIGIDSFQTLRRRERMGLLLVAEQLKRMGIETLDRPRVHYLAGRARFIGTGLEDLSRDPSSPDAVIISQEVFEQTMEMRLQTNTVPAR